MKINLQVNADFDLDGNIHPKAIVWEDGRVFEIDRVLDVRRLRNRFRRLNLREHYCLDRAYVVFTCAKHVRVSG